MKISELRNLAKTLAKDFGVKYQSLTELSSDEPHFGDCSPNRRIRIRLRQYRRRASLKHTTIIDTLCHEFAHLIQWNHGKKHRIVLKLMRHRARELLNGI